MIEPNGDIWIRATDLLFWRIYRDADNQTEKHVRAALEKVCVDKRDKGDGQATLFRVTQAFVCEHMTSLSSLGREHFTPNGRLNNKMIVRQLEGVCPTNLSNFDQLEGVWKDKVDELQKVVGHLSDNCQTKDGEIAEYRGKIKSLESDAYAQRIAYERLEHQVEVFKENQQAYQQLIDSQQKHIEMLSQNAVAAIEQVSQTLMVDEEDEPIVFVKQPEQTQEEDIEDEISFVQNDQQPVRQETYIGRMARLCREEHEYKQRLLLEEKMRKPPTFFEKVKQTIRKGMPQ